MKFKKGDIVWISFLWKIKSFKIEIVNTEQKFYLSDYYLDTIPFLLPADEKELFKTKQQAIDYFQRETNKK